MLQRPVLEIFTTRGKEERLDNHYEEQMCI